jgi:hypothetical protein
MPARLLLLLANAFIVAYSLDAGFSLVEEAFRHLTGSNVLVSWRNLLAGLVVLGSLAVVPAIVLTPRLPPSVLAPLALSALWMAFGAAPLPLLLERPALDAALVGLQLALAGIGFLRIRALSGGRSWLLGSESPRRPAFSLAHSLLALGAVVVGGIALILAYLPLWFLVSIQLMTDGFVRFDLAGVSLADRRYERDDQEVRLVGMMHIGEAEAYQALVESFSGSSTVVLAEGVTDRERLLEVPFSYEGAARALGLDTQDEIEAYLDAMEAPEHRQWPDVRHADVDLSDFHPDTISWLGWVDEIWGGEDPLGAFARLYARYIEESDRWAVVFEDVLTRRNHHLLDALQVALMEYDRVIVPWGALHLPFVQHQVLEMGFEPTTRTHHPLASWKTILAALFPG